MNKNNRKQKRHSSNIYIRYPQTHTQIHKEIRYVSVLKNFAIDTQNI